MPAGPGDGGRSFLIQLVGVIFAAQLAVDGVQLIVFIHHGQELVKIVFVHQLRFAQADALPDGKPALEPEFCARGIPNSRRTIPKKSDISFIFQNASTTSTSS